jgi:predicted ArsR family transcriptional regulator
MRYAARPDQIAKTHQALAQVSRLRLLDILRATPSGLSAPDAAAQISLHVATVRTHLETLVAAGLATRATEATGARGRPRVVYAATHDSQGLVGNGYRLLAELLVSLIENSVRSPAQQAETAGAAWGRSLIERPRPLARLPRMEALQRVHHLLDELGFEPVITNTSGGTEIMCHRCPFRDVAGDHQSVVCSVHLGLIKGALEELGVPTDTTTIEPFVTPTLCVAHLGFGSR